MYTFGRVATNEKNELGYTEGKNNDNKYGKEYGFNNVPWCMIFQQIMAEHSDGKGRMLRTASCGALWKWAQQNKMLIDQPLPGALVIFTFKKDKNGNPETNHVGFCLGTTSNGKYTYTTEGNTSANSTGSQANGDCVAFKKRPITQVYGKKYIMPPYDKVKTKKVQNTREITVWSAPTKLDACRTRTITPQEITVYDELIPSFSTPGEYFYRTIKNAFVLAKYCKEVQ